MSGLRGPFVLMYDVDRVVHWARAIKDPDGGAKYYAQPCGTGSRCIPTFYGPEPIRPTCLWCVTYTILSKS